MTEDDKSYQSTFTNIVTSGRAPKYIGQTTLDDTSLSLHTVSHCQKNVQQTDCVTFLWNYYSMSNGRTKELYLNILNVDLPLRPRDVPYAHGTSNKRTGIQGLLKTEKHLLNWLMALNLNSLGLSSYTALNISTFKRMNAADDECYLCSILIGHFVLNIFISCNSSCSFSVFSPTVFTCSVCVQLINLDIAISICA